MYDIIKTFPKVDKELVAKFAAIEESASINESLTVNGALNHSIRPLWPETRLCGTAFTIQARPGDNLIIHKALQLIEPGDVLVITCDGFLEAGGMFGGVMSTFAQKRGCAGLVMDGSVRDSIHIKEIGFPVFSCGVSVRSSTKITGGKINHPINICDVTVHPGDLVFGDNDSVVIVPREQAAEVYERTHKREEYEQKVLKDINEKGVSNYEQFEKAFAALGLTEEEV
ncbi:RraA family protein [Halalkalibacter oceani]|uniref:RraA family protein n=1 Tax=Halalkalibacter oceani TaxID=1653776 RepID=UPI003392FB5C